MSKIIIFILALLYTGCGCRDKNDTGSVFLDKDYDFVLGFAVPDEDRLVPTEIFVGRLLDHEVEELYLQGLQDSFLRVGQAAMTVERYLDLD